MSCMIDVAELGERYAIDSDVRENRLSALTCADRVRTKCKVIARDPAASWTICAQHVVGRQASGSLVQRTASGLPGYSTRRALPYGG